MLDGVNIDQRYRAVATRDARFDGAFVLAVRTTGIYCRPSCPARTPLPANVEFFTTSAAAHERGYRACKRCLPDAVPGSPEWNLRSDLAARAMRLIADGVVERDGVTGLSARLGYTSRHLNRVLTAELGAGALALARAHRAQTARQLLVGTDLPIGDIAFAAGFGSVRQFNDTITEIYDRTPSQLRAVRRIGQAPAATEPQTIRLALPVRPPFDANGVFAWLAARAISGIEAGDGHSYSRTLALPGGPASFTVRAEADRLLLTAQLASLTDLPPLVARVRRLFDADADPIGIDTALAGDPALAGSVRAVPGIRLPGTADAAELLLRALLGQQVSVAAARTHLNRLASAVGDPLAAPATEGLTRLFPTAAQIAEHGSALLAGPAKRVATILDVAARLASGELDLGWADDPAVQHDRLIAIPGIGEWTAGYVAMRVLGHPDILPAGDAAVRAGARSLGLPHTPGGLDAWGATIAPWRSYATMHLWRAAAALRDAPSRRSSGTVRDAPSRRSSGTVHDKPSRRSSGSDRSRRTI